MSDASVASDVSSLSGVSTDAQVERREVQLTDAQAERKRKKNLRAREKKKSKKLEKRLESLTIATAELTTSETENARLTDVCPDSTNPRIYQLRAKGDDAGAGYGAFASSNLRRGSRLLEAEPVLVDMSHNLIACATVVGDLVTTMTDHDCDRFLKMPACAELIHRYQEIARLYLNNNGKSPEIVQEKMMLLTLKDIISLFGASTDKHDFTYENNKVALDYYIVYLSKFERNALLLEHHEKGGKGIFAEASRFNHSCKPNAIYAWNKDTGKLTINALHPIKKGEEITIDRCPEVQYDHAARRQWLRYHYSLDCECSGCVGPAAEQSKIKRARLTELNVIVNTWYIPKDPNEANTRAPKVVRSAVHEVLQIHRAEGLISPDTARLYTIKAIFAAEHRDSSNVIHYKQEAYETLVRCLGLDHPRVGYGIRELDELWECRDDMKTTLYSLWSGIDWQEQAVLTTRTTHIDKNKILREMTEAHNRIGDTGADIEGAKMILEKYRKSKQRENFSDAADEMYEDFSTWHRLNAPSWNHADASAGLDLSHAVSQSSGEEPLVLADERVSLPDRERESIAREDIRLLVRQAKALYENFLEWRTEAAQNRLLRGPQ